MNRLRTVLAGALAAACALAVASAASADRPAARLAPAAPAWANPAVGRIGTEFGMVRDPVTGRLRLHDGTDIVAPRGTPVRAASAGVVTVTADPALGPHFVTVTAPSGVVSGYGYLDSTPLRTGDQVFPGQRVGAIGARGLASSPHLHFMIIKHGKPVDPVPFLRGHGVTLGRG